MKPRDGGRVTLDEYRALASFRRALRIFLRFSEDAARDVGITPAQHQLLLAVKGFDGGAAPSVGDVAEALQQRHHSTVELVDRAAAAGLVARLEDPDDARRHLLVLTSEGERILERLSDLHRSELRRFRTDVLAHLDAIATGGGS
ncbi:MAG TPA: MarR family winged helix-turn-helix transcriptional regulator [Acidimicrobiales bacterium]|nr:MarR family winged helix-turn-helix transcriptional regulator [Acidimicrobiales bacterium]